MNRFLWPAVVFVVLAVLLGAGLQLNPREVPSPLIGKPAPAFAAPILSDPTQRIAREDLLGKVWMLNVWASWCGACKEEHPALLAFARRGLVPVYGLDYKDERQAGLAWLRAGGNPYTESIVDADGRIGIDFGVYGVPETFIIDRQGVIRFKHIGPLTPELLRDRVEPLLRQLNG
jgi:cytochrome c biogenesis protein CcmG/thiol:disulfide interchange protein DsbE